MRYRWIQSHRLQFPVQLMCKVLRVSRSGFYAWQQRPTSCQAQRRQHIKQAARAAYHASDRIYGYRKVHQEVVEQGLTCSLQTVRRVLHQEGLFSKVKRRKQRIVTTNSKHHQPVAANLLKRDFSATKPNQKWVADITYIETDEGWLYMSAIMDLYSRKIVGWSMADHLRSDLVCDALRMALGRRGLSEQLIHHSDRGVQYASLPFQDLLAVHGITCSMSGKANCYDNAAMESFFSHMKSEWVYHDKYATREQAKQSVFRYVEMFYNRRRRHASLGYLSPEAYERHNVT